MSASQEHSAARLLEALNSVLCKLGEPSKVLSTILGQAVSQTGADRGIFVEVAPSGKLAYRVLYRFQNEEVGEKEEHYSRHVLAHVQKSGESMLLDNALDDPRFRTKESVLNYRITSVLCVPIRIADEVKAIIYLESNRPGHFRDRHRGILQSLVEVASPVLQTLQTTQGVMQERDALRLSEDRAREELQESREVLARDWSFSRFVGRSRAVRDLEQQLRKAAATDFPVLILGETGTGKSILARVLHHTGARAKKPFATLFCPSLEKGMVETELFGHKRGAFTGAVADRVGKVQAVEKGTLFLDEIGELPLDIQPKLLRLLQEKTYERVGEATEREADVRVVAATNRDLADEVAANRFRRDLYERLNFLRIRIPPLRERPDDIPLLLEHCLAKYDAGRWIRLSPDAVQFLVELDFAWPGNVRHLEHLAARLAMEQEQQGPVTRETLERLLDEAEPGGEERKSPEELKARLDLGLPSLLAQEEKKWLQLALERYPGLKRSDLAAKLKISPAVLYKKLKIFGLGS